MASRGKSEQEYDPFRGVGSGKGMRRSTSISPTPALQVGCETPSRPNGSTLPRSQTPSEPSSLQPTDPQFFVREAEVPWPAWVQGFRPQQVDAVDQIIDAYERGVDVVMLDAPTGAGKTLIAEMVRRRLGSRAVYICSGKDLQDQFLRDFEYARVLKGRGNYPTELFPAYSCEDCAGVRCRWCEGKESCPYIVAKKAAGGAVIGVLNTAYALAEWNGAKSQFRNRELVVVDEADTLEAGLMGWVDVRLSERQMAELGLEAPVKGARVKTVKAWLMEVEKELKERVRGLKGDDVDTIRKRSRYFRVQTRVAKVLEGIGGEDAEGKEIWGDWVRDYDDKGTFILKPVKVSEVGPAAVWAHAKKWLLMSASLISGEEIAESLGVEEAGLSWEMVSVGMNFPVENRPIYYRPKANLTYKTMMEERPKLLEALGEVLEEWPDENVLVHTVSYPLTRWLEKEVKRGRRAGGRRVWSYANAQERASVLERFKDKGGVLLAPSMDRGIDLAEDLCRVVVVTKLPFPSLGDRQVSERMRTPGGQMWYAVQVARTLVQMTGRGVRSESDWAATYVLDRQFGKFWGGWGRKIMPAWWKEALR